MEGCQPLIGSFTSWATFSVLFSFLTKTGIELGYGMVSALLSLVVISSTLREWAGRTNTRPLDAVAPIGIVGTTVVAAIALQAGTPELEFEGHRLGLFVTGLGGGLAVVGFALSRRHQASASDPIAD